jgi:hypothetical protein
MAVRAATSSDDDSRQRRVRGRTVQLCVPGAVDGDPRIACLPEAFCQRSIVPSTKRGQLDGATAVDRASRPR